MTVELCFFPKVSLIMGNSFSPLADEPCGTQSVPGLAPVHTFYSHRSWIEGSTTQQLETIASLPGVKAVAAMPDLHPGKFGPVGCAMLAERVHPQFVGADIGCGMGLFQLNVPMRKLRADKIAERLRVLEGPWNGDAATMLTDAGLNCTAFDASLGTIGGGNHFCEVQAIEEIIEPKVAARAGLDRQLAYVLVHSGSRGLGAIAVINPAKYYRAQSGKSFYSNGWIPAHPSIIPPASCRGNCSTKQSLF